MNPGRVAGTGRQNEPGAINWGDPKINLMLMRRTEVQKKQISTSERSRLIQMVISNDRNYRILKEKDLLTFECNCSKTIQQ